MTPQHFPPNEAERLRDQTRLLTLTADMVTAVTTHDRLVDLLQASADALVRNLDIAAARIWLLDAPSGVLHLEASAGGANDGETATAVPVGTPGIGSIAATRSALVQDAGDAAGHGLVAFAGYPLLLGERVLGVVAMWARQPFTKTTLTALGPVATSLAVGIEQLLTNARVRLSRGELERFRAMLDGTQDCILIFDPDTLRISYANQGAARQLGYSVEELVGMRPLELKPYVTEAEYRQRLTSLLHGEVPVMLFETIHRHRDGHDIQGEELLQCVAPEGESPSFINIVRDISERTRVTRLQSEFVSMVSHELRTPLTSIQGALMLIAGGVVGEVPAEASEFVDIALVNCDRLMRLINEILDTEKIRAGQMEFRLQRVTLAVLLSDAIDANATFASHHSVTLQLLRTAAGVVTADPHRLEQVLANLISNAVKFSPRESVVELACDATASGLKVSIRDRGPGIPEAFRSRIFQRFAQADDSSGAGKGGTGLGLNISKAIVEQLGGSIGFEPAQGGGTTFFFELPVHAQKAELTGQ